MITLPEHGNGPVGQSRASPAAPDGRAPAVRATIAARRRPGAPPGERQGYGCRSGCGGRCWSSWPWSPGGPGTNGDAGAVARPTAAATGPGRSGAPRRGTGPARPRRPDRAPPPVRPGRARSGGPTSRTPTAAARRCAPAWCCGPTTGAPRCSRSPVRTRAAGTTTSASPRRLGPGRRPRQLARPRRAPVRAARRLLPPRRLLRPGAVAAGTATARPAQPGLTVRAFGAPPAADPLRRPAGARTVPPGLSPRPRRGR